MSARPQVGQRQKRQELRRALHSLGAVITLVTITAQQAASQRPSGDQRTIVISVRDDGGPPIPFADFMIAGGRSGLADAHGHFSVTGRLGDTLRIRVRRIGFSPAVVQVPLARAETDSVALRLSAVALRLDGVAVK